MDRRTTDARQHEIVEDRQGAPPGPVRRLRTVLLASVSSVGCLAAGGASAQTAQPAVSICSGSSVTLPIIAGGATVGVTALDPNGNLLTLAPGTNCSLALTSPNGITVGGGRTDGLGGTGATATTGASTAIAIGNGSNAGTVNASALGTGANATTSGAVALGSGSVANRLNASTELFTGNGLRTTLGVASVGSVGNERQITNVAGGLLDTDAANVGQLRSVGTSLAGALGGGAGFNATTGVFTNPTYTIRGANYANVGGALTAADNALGLNANALANLQLGLNTGTIGLVQQNPTTRTITVGANTDGTLVNVTGTAGARRLTGVAAGTGPTDAVDVTQLNSAIASVGAGSAALSSENSGGAAPALATGLRSVAVGYGSVATAPDTLSVGAPGTERRIVNVAAGTLASGSTDAVTGGQLFATNNAVASNATNLGTLYGRLTASLGGGAAYNAGTGAFTFPSYSIRGTTYNSVGTAFAAVDNALSNIGGGGGGGGNAAPIAGNSPDGTQAPVAGGANSVAGGYQSRAVGPSSTALGDSSVAGGDSASSFGSQSAAMADGSSAFGTNSQAMALNTTAIGMSAAANFEGSTAIGAGARAIADPTTAVGYQALASGNDAVAVGAFSSATGTDASAIGSYSTASGDSSTALGRQAVASGTNATAIGHSASAGGVNSIAIGQGASANQDNSIAVGVGVATSRPNQVAIGGGGSSYTLAGLGSGASNAAQSGATRFVTTDTAGNLGTSDYGPDSIGAMAGQVTQLNNSVNQLTHFAVAARREARSGIASAMAMAGAPMPSAAGKTSWAANGSSFKGEWASGFALAHRLDVAMPIAVTAGYSYGDAAGHGVRFGLAGEF